ncbi:hypothetical protein, partial [Enterobacter hormaechei]|uniref:hypothetical protein n=1 Tax=Enterobacter hormaechei TaxID=158836 RepID=UPI001954220E
AQASASRGVQSARRSGAAAGRVDGLLLAADAGGSASDAARAVGAGEDAAGAGDAARPPRPACDCCCSAQARP